MPPTRRIIDDAFYVHFVTFSVDGRRKLLDHEHPKRIVLGVLNNLLSGFGAKCVGFVIMPEHVHALIWLPQTGRLSAFMHEWKRVSSIQIRKWYRTEAPEYAKSFEPGPRFWLPKYYAFEIYERDKIEEKLNYMHANPVRRGLVECATDWKWSSARWYVLREDVGIPIEWVE